MNIALTGATGFAGRLILAELQAAAQNIKTLVRKQVTTKQNSVEFIIGDLASPPALAKLVENCEVVVHVAGAIAARNRAGYFETNLQGTKRLYLAAKAAKCRRFIYVSSITAREPLLSHYAASKAAAEQFLLGHEAGPEVIILRPCAIYGPGDKATLPLLKTLQNKIAIVPGKATSRFSLIHVQDFARIVAEAVSAQNVRGIFELDDLSGGHNWQDLVDANRGVTDRPQKIIYAPQVLASTVATCAELIGKISQQVSVTNRGKVKELYHHDWVARGVNWPRDNPIRLSEGYAETLQWYIQEGLLPNKAQIVRRQA